MIEALLLAIVPDIKHTLFVYFDESQDSVWDQLYLSL